MSSCGNPDFSGLARLAQRRDGGLRPVLLTSQAALFAEAPRRDPRSIATFETLALGIIPLVGMDTLRAVAAVLARVADAPPRVLALLAERLGDPNLGLAQDRTIVLDGRRLSGLIDAARKRPELAAALLARPEPGVFDRAALYRAADSAQRRAIREDLARTLPSGATGRLALPPDLRARVRGAADGREAATILASYGIGPTPEAAACGLAGSVAEQEIFALALVALGLAPEECVPLFLTLDPIVSNSAEAVFHLAAVVRATPRSVAAWLADPDDRALAAEVAARHLPSLHAGGSFARPGQPVRGPVDPARRGREGGDPLDRRSKATTDRDRT